MSTDSVAKKIYEIVDAEIDWIAQSGAEHWGEFCESPIETILLCAMTLVPALNSWAVGSTFPFTVAVQKQTEPPADVLWRIVPQYRWGNYRIDFAIFVYSKEPSIFVECDGHDFHERTPEQAERDRIKDRSIQAAGIPIFRFTGREIYRSPSLCFLQIANFFREHDATKVNAGDEKPALKIL